MVSSLVRGSFHSNNEQTLSESNTAISRGNTAHIEISTLSLESPICLQMVSPAPRCEVDSNALCESGKNDYSLSYNKNMTLHYFQHYGIKIKIYISTHNIRAHYQARIKSSKLQ